MDWNLFWNAFEAIGTTLGSLVTAVAVVVAVKQYKQPLKKIVKVKFTSAASCDELGNPLCFYCISINNMGVRVIQIDSLNIRGNKKNLWINDAQFKSNVKIILPVKVEPEENKNFLFEVDHFKHAIKQAVDDDILRRKQRLVIFVTDSLGDKYVCRTNIRIGSLIKDL